MMRLRKVPWQTLLVPAAAALLLACCAEASAPGDVLLITVDALRPDHLGLYGYGRPTSRNLDRWMSDATVFSRAYSVGSQTATSVPSMLSGRLPQDHGVRIIWQLLPDDTPLIPDLLPPSYQTAAFVSNMVLTTEANGIGKRFDHYDDFVDERESDRLMFERNAARTVDAAVHWLSEGRDPARPLFLWVHLIDPHGPYEPPADWAPRFDHPSPRPIDPERVAEYMRLPDVDDGLVYVDRYDEEIAFADHHLGRLLRSYSENADWEEALIIFSSDHGESMMEHERWFAHGYHVYEEIVRVPLAVRGPGADPGRRDDLVSTIDIAPTILRFTGAPVPADLRGIDLRAAGEADPDRSVFVEGYADQIQWRAELRGDRKWMVKLGRGAREIEETRFYDLAADPGELSPKSWPVEDGAPSQLLDLCAADPDPGGLPESYERGARLSAPKIAERADPQTLEKLRSLGYVDP